MITFRCLLLGSLATLSVAFSAEKSFAADDKQEGSLEGGAVQVLEAITVFDVKSPDFLLMYTRAIKDLRSRLENEAARDELLKKLSTLTTRQLVTLWDGFWLESNANAAGGQLGKLRDLNDLADGFAAKFNAANLAALAGEKDVTRQQLFVNMTLPQKHTMTEAQVKEWERLSLKVSKVADAAGKK